MRGFRDRMCGDGFDMVEAYILRHGRGRESHGEHRRDFMRGFKGGMFGGGFRTGRKFDAADLQLIILAMLSEQPRHGYELIKTFEERSGGFYVPSPGVIYPALTYLEETGQAEVEASGTKKLYRIRDGAQIAGVCAGLGAYFDIDVNWMRVLFLVATVLTSGFFIFVYIAMMFIIPSANTSEEWAAAHGVPFNAQEVIDRA